MAIQDNAIYPNTLDLRSNDEGILSKTVKNTADTLAQIQEKSLKRFSDISSKALEGINVSVSRIGSVIDEPIDELATATAGPLYEISKKLLGIDSLTTFLKGALVSVLTLPKSLLPFSKKDKAPIQIESKKMDDKILKTAMKSKALEEESRDTLEDIYTIVEKIWHKIKKTDKDSNGLLAGGILGFGVKSLIQGILSSIVIPAAIIGLGYAAYKYLGSGYKHSGKVIEKLLDKVVKPYIDFYVKTMTGFLSKLIKFNFKIIEIGINFIRTSISELFDFIRNNSLLPDFISKGMPSEEDIKKSFNTVEEKIGKIRTKMLDFLEKVNKKVNRFVVTPKESDKDKKDKFEIKVDIYKLPKEKKEIIEEIKETSLKSGINPKHAVVIASLESDFSPTAKNPKSTAKGVFQFVEDTAKLVKLPLDKRTDVKESTKAFAKLTKADAQMLKDAGIEVTALRSYLTHLLGGPDAIKLIKKAEAGEKVTNRLRKKLEPNIGSVDGDLAQDYINRAGQKYKSEANKLSIEVDIFKTPFVSPKTEVIEKQDITAPTVEREKISMLYKDIIDMREPNKEMPQQPIIINQGNKGGNLIEESGTAIAGIPAMLDSPYIIMANAGLL